MLKLCFLLHVMLLNSDKIGCILVVSKLVGSGEHLCFVLMIHDTPLHYVLSDVRGQVFGTDPYVNH